MYLNNLIFPEIMLIEFNFKTKVCFAILVKIRDGKFLQNETGSS